MLGRNILWSRLVYSIMSLLKIQAYCFPQRSFFVLSIYENTLALSLISWAKYFIEAWWFGVFISMERVCLCPLRICTDMNDFSQCKHQNSFPQVWVLSWDFKWLNLEHLQSHCEQLNGLSPVWVFSCCFKVPDVEHL